MLVNVVDYSPAFFSTPVAPGGNLVDPGVRRGKFVLLENQQGQVCVFSPIQQSEFHANIVERYTSQKGVTGHYNSRQDKYYLHDENWKVVGGGHWEYDKLASRVVLSGRSLAYGGLMLEPLVNDLMDFDAFDGATILCA